MTGTPLAPAPPGDRTARLRLDTPAGAVLLVALGLGAALRLHDVGRLAIVDDEFHLVHRLLAWTPREMLLNFHIADYGIPLGLAYHALARLTDLTELTLRLPMLACGVATLVALPLASARRDPAVAALFAMLLALSPTLILYSEMARPYAITLLIGWLAHYAFPPALLGRRRYALAYVVCTALSIWLHPVTAPFVLAPFVTALPRLAALDRAARRATLRRLAVLAVVTAAAVAACVLPPLLAHPEVLRVRAGLDTPTWDTLWGALHWWLGTRSAAVVALSLALAALGARRAFAQSPELASIAVGLALALAALFVTQPAHVEKALTFGRYLLPALPLLLLAMAHGALRIARWLFAARALPAGLLAGLPVVALAATSPLADLLATPNSYRLASVSYFDYRPGRNPFIDRHAMIPLSTFWQTLRALPPDTRTIAAAPFYFETYDWDGNRWERIARQRVIPGYLSGLCVPWRYGEIPRGGPFRFANGVHLADREALARAGVTHVFWQKPYVQHYTGHAEPIGAPTRHCEAALRTAFGDPVHEDAAALVFALRPAAR